MSLAHFVVTTVDDGGRIRSRLSTNAAPARVKARLARLCLLELVEDIDREEDRERVRGGNAILLVWNDGVTVNDLIGKLDQV